MEVRRKGYISPSSAHFVPTRDILQAYSGENQQHSLDSLFVNRFRPDSQETGDGAVDETRRTVSLSFWSYHVAPMLELGILVTEASLVSATLKSVAVLPIHGKSLLVAGQGTGTGKGEASRLTLVRLRGTVNVYTPS